mmetsp:Transcript_138/g.205  ORF Transcript_138/g.205 Transcript_138/m.205 type:complete len:173 (-) Transcript_138:100-618(-)
MNILLGSNPEVEVIGVRSWEVPNAVPVSMFPVLFWRLLVGLGQALLAMGLLLYLCWEVRAVRECAGLIAVRRKKRRTAKEKGTEESGMSSASAPETPEGKPLSTWVRPDDVGPAPDVVPAAPAPLPVPKATTTLPRQRRDRSTSLEGSSRNCHRKGKESVRGTRAASRRCRR